MRKYKLSIKNRKTKSKIRKIKLKKNNKNNIYKSRRKEKNNKT